MRRRTLMRTTTHARDAPGTRPGRRGWTQGPVPRSVSV